MYYRRRKLVFVFTLLLAQQLGTCFAQTNKIKTDSIYALDGVVVNGDRFHYEQKKMSNIRIDSFALLHENSTGIAEVLRYNSLIYIKDYGPGNIATTSARGGSAEQTQVFWNGININQAGLGMSDLSLMPSFLMDDITVQQSPSGAGFGSGSISGNILLSNKNSGNKGLYSLVKQTFSSIGESNSGLRLGYNGNKWSVDVRYNVIASKNNYQYKIPMPVGTETEQQQNAAYNQKGVSITSSYKFSEYSKLSLYAWYTDLDRNIPPAISATNLSHQIDKSVKTSVQWDYQKKKHSWHYKSAYINDYFNYVQVPVVYSTMNTNTMVNEWEQRYEASKSFTFSGGITQTYQSVKTLNYSGGEHDRWRWALFGGVTWKSKLNKSNVNFLIRKERYATFYSPVVYSLSISQKIVKGITFLIKGDRHYRIPSMNDLYWNPGGNASLKPENGWNAEASLNNVISVGRVKNIFSVDVFSRWINDWIIWLPSNGGGIWTPQNISKVWSKGVEIKEEVQIQCSKKLNINISWKHTIQRSIKEDSDFPGDQSYQKQLIYVPLYMGNVGLMVQYKNMYFSYRQQYTSWVYTLSDNSAFLNPYTTGIARVGGKIHAKLNTVELYAEVNNCWNVSYQIVQAMAMPLRYYRVGLIYKWN